MAKKKPTMSFKKEENNGDMLQQVLSLLSGKNDKNHVNRLFTQHYIKDISEITNLWVNVAGLIARQEDVEPLLSEIYDKNKLMYHTAREEVFEGAYIPNNFDIITEIRIQKVLGVIAKNIQDNDFTSTERLLKATYKQVYNYLKARNHIDLNDFRQRELSKESTVIKGFERLRKSTTVLIYFLLTEQICIDKHMDNFTERMMELTSVIESMDIAEIVNPELVDEEIPLPPYITLMLEGFTDSIFSKETHLEFIAIWEKLYDNVLLSRNNKQLHTMMLTEPFRSLLHFLEIKYRNVQLDTVLTFFDRFSVLGVNRRYFIEQRISKENFLDVLTDSVKLYREGGFDSVDFIIYFTDSLVMTILVNDLKYTRNYMLRDDEIETIKAEREYLTDMEEKDALILQLQQQLQRKTNENEQLIKQMNSNSELNVLQKRVRELEKQLEVQEDNSKELYALREFMFEFNQKEEANTENIDYVQALQDESIVFIGGHDKWINAMKKVLPNALYLNADSNGRDYSRIKQPNTTVFIHTAYNNHGTYYKAVALLKETDNKLYFINNTNVELILRDMYQKIKVK